MVIPNEMVGTSHRDGGGWLALSRVIRVVTAKGVSVQSPVNTVKIRVSRDKHPNQLTKLQKSISGLVLADGKDSRGWL